MIEPLELARPPVQAAGELVSPAKAPPGKPNRDLIGLPPIRLHFAE
jgi:hypothetical protein